MGLVFKQRQYFYTAALPPQMTRKKSGNQWIEGADKGKVVPVLN
jgi:hypothetical protein